MIIHVLNAEVFEDSTNNTLILDRIIQYINRIEPNVLVIGNVQCRHLKQIGFFSLCLLSNTKIVYNTYSKEYKHTTVNISDSVILVNDMVFPIIQEGIFECNLDYPCTTEYLYFNLFTSRRFQQLIDKHSIGRQIKRGLKASLVGFKDK